ncbi:polysaccharide pyruvyl transferase family protein [Thalassotalea euphylliae]|uniref:polysaccharide pyruvyl transferase family protein n=1 Tax=Thalassotalea euphylliae TaxID=1655234 RepID=UPI003625624B
MDKLCSSHDVILPLILNKRVHYVDMPVHNNIGDLLIMFGTLEFFNKNNINVVSKSAYYNFVESNIRKGDVIVFHGGGNLGDIYFGPQNLRETITERFPNNTIIILPQSIHFNEQKNLERCTNIFKKHNDLHICIRDKESLSVADSMTNNTYLLPDMAHHLWQSNNFDSTQSGTKRLAIVRTDGEISESFSLDNTEFDLVTDWPALVGKGTKVINLYARLLKLAHKLKIDKYLNKPLMKLFELYANHLVGKAISLYGSSNFIATDRLHGHILACLMTIEHSPQDNIYGKTSRYMKVWTGDSPYIV